MFQLLVYCSSWFRGKTIKKKIGEGFFYGIAKQREITQQSGTNIQYGALQPVVRCNNLLKKDFFSGLVSHVDNNQNACTGAKWQDLLNRSW